MLFLTDFFFFLRDGTGGYSSGIGTVQDFFCASEMDRSENHHLFHPLIDSCWQKHVKKQRCNSPANVVKKTAS